MTTKKSQQDKRKNNGGWNKGKKGLQVAWNKGLTKDDYRVKKYTNSRLNTLKKNPNILKKSGIKISQTKKRLFKEGKLIQHNKGKKGWTNKGSFKEGKVHPNWVGDNIKYSSLHDWIRKHKPKSFFCEKCGKITDKLEISNTSGEYKRDISDFRWLCISCHRKFDNHGRKNVKTK